MTLLDRLALNAAGPVSEPALQWPGGELGYAALLGLVRDTAAMLVERGIRVLAVDLDNGPAWVVLDLAALHGGVCLVPLPGFFSAGQLAHALQASGAQAVVSNDPARLRRQLGSLLDPGSEPLTIGPQRLSWIALDPDADKPREPIPPGIDKVTFTSGTTGQPKGVMLSWDQMRPVVTSLVAAVGLAPGDRHLALMPLAVLLENLAGIYAPLWAGATVSLVPMAGIGVSGATSVNGGMVARELRSRHATTAIFTPQTLHALVEAVENGASTMPALRFAAVGGAPVSPRLLHRARAAGIPVYEGYGLSECCSVVCLNTPAANRPGSVGRPLGHVRIRISRDGEILIDGQHFSGYLGDRTLPVQAWRSGDLGTMDDDGYVYLKGRRRNVFITAAGRNVAPEWVESELTLEPAIAQAAVFGEAMSENVAVIVAARGAAPGDIGQAIARVNRALPDYARVARWLPADAPFAPANGLLTGTGRVRREAVWHCYRGRIQETTLENAHHE
jgi:long-subunit acyl-CoA synthetase (AMP-forming)